MPLGKVYVYIGITLSGYSLTQHLRKINLEYSLKMEVILCIKYRFP